MTIGYRHGLSILELVFYFLSLFVAVFLVVRHGFRTNSGFLFLAIFALARIVGACCDLATINNPSAGLFTAAAICSSIGLSPLMLACAGLLSRADLSIEKMTGRKALPNLTFNIFRLVTIAALALSIAGITANMSPSGFQTPDSKVKIGMALYVLCWAMMVAILVLLSLRRGESKQAKSVPCWPLPSFSMLDGNVTALLMMSVLEEIIVVIICLSVGMTLQVRARGNQEQVDRGDDLPSYQSGKP
ncbi:hypothetical protein POX_c03929 [Penicillium oxalicum]|uniref:hypothetical protein n=1 Tax=Penicillium oxalicum TaxID=69781 RepID=UPI0020B67BDE|nr:hypothetical protein POX_c03929 [Penicillium oxalicum]KAI2791074.1 hypothetical protein POX_c03929 [Penicillium oxalicum]